MGIRDKYLKDIHIPYMELPDSYRPGAFKEDYVADFMSCHC